MTSLILAASAAATLSPQGALAIAVVSGVLTLSILRPSVPVEILFLSGLAAVTLGGAIPAETALAGFASGPVLLIGALLAAAAGLQTTGAIDWIGKLLLGSAQTERQALRRMTLVTAVSAFILNTPLVAMLMPVVIDWCRKHSISPSRMMMPLSYMVILGGVGTVIGTSTTLVCNAQIAEVRDNVTAKAPEGALTPAFLDGMADIGFFEITWIGLPIALAGIVYMLVFSPRLLPDRTDLVEDFSDRQREYLVEMLAQPGCGLVGKTVEQAGLRQLPGLFLIEIRRNEESITPIAPGDVIHANDHMVFTGVVNTIADLERIPGLVPAIDQTYESRPAERTNRQLVEAVLSRTSPVIGQTVRDANFRQLYNAAIVAVHRGGERMGTKIGDIRLQPGDTLLLQARSGFVETHRNSRDFYLVSQVGGSSARRHDRAAVAAILFLLLLVWLVATSLGAAGVTSAPWLLPSIRPIAAVAIVMAMVGARCLTVNQARAAMDLQVLITVGAAMGLGGALSHSGAAQFVADYVVRGTQLAPIPEVAFPWLLLTVVYFLSMILTEAISNAAVATIMIPIVVGIAQQTGLNPRPFLMAVTIAASLSFATPVGYQTNLMVMGPGGYHPKDFLRVGGLLQLFIAIMAIPLLGLLWPLTY
jgi:di/tricarboxylate transporter